MATYTYVNVPLPEAKRLADLYGMAWDLEACRKYCERYLGTFKNMFAAESEEAKHLECYSVFVFVRYGRCFKGGIRDKTAKEALAALTPEDIALHQLVIDIRDKYVAHSVNDLESHKARVWLNPEEYGRKINNVNIESLYLAGPEPALFEALKRLVDKLLSWIDSERRQEEDRLVEVVAGKFALSELYALEAECPDRTDYSKVARPRRGP